LYKKLAKFLKFIQIHFITSLVTAKSSSFHNNSYSWEQFLCNYWLHWGSCWTRTVDSWELRFWHREDCEAACVS